MVKKSISRNLLVLFSLMVLPACQTASSREPMAISAGSLAEDYERSSSDVRAKYDGKEITVRGYTRVAVLMPRSADDQGSLLLAENEDKPARHVACWFSNDQAEQFSKISGAQYITVRGVFTGEIGAELRFCKLVKVE